MSAEKTVQALAAITDEGLFECMATAILREANPNYRSLAHPGVNAAGKTVKSPLDGICFVQGSNLPHMIAVHHTITARDDLEKKWLHDPSKVKHRKGTRFIAPAGDLIKTLELVTDERRCTPNLRVTLVLTTNEEPGEALVRTVEAAGRDHGVEIDLWARSRLSHFLDTQPTGQWIRHLYLGVEQEQLSPELLLELSQKSLEIYCPLDNPAAWVPRALDTTLTTNINRDVTFLVAESGMGKSVACYRKLVVHVNGGGFGIVLPHEVIASAMTLEQAVTTTLRQLHSPLVAESASALSFCSPERPLLLVVEDINRSGQTQILAEKLASWSHTPTKEEKHPYSNWRLLCPLWPEVLASLGEQARKRIESLIVMGSGFSASEGRDAILARARLAGRELSPLSAEAISLSLGHDPLLIALNEHCTAPASHQIIGQFIEGSLSRVSSAGKDYPAADYRLALRTLAGEMLAKRQIELAWREVRGWASLQGEPLRLLGHLAHHGELIRMTGQSDDQRLSFRHDRVRDWLLADAVAEQDRRDLLAEQVIADPYFAEVIGAVLVWGHLGSSFLQRVASSNPLALFHALRVFGQACKPPHIAILQAINRWLDDPTTHDLSNNHLRWEALAMLAGTDSPEVPAIVRKFRERIPSGQLARFRNGDIGGGIELCINMDPGVGAPWRDSQIEHAKLRYGHNLVKALEEFLRRTDLDNAARIGALRLSGHVADASLALAIEACWIADNERCDHLAAYLWAFAECCGDDPARYLGPACDAWAALSNQSDKKGWPSPRESVADHELRWAFHKWPPKNAIDYFIQRGSQDDLRWPITYMLHGMDHPKAIHFVVQELAAIRRRLDGTKSFWPFLQSSRDEWRRAQENGHPMSVASRDLLFGLWQRDTNDKHLRGQAFSFWAATKHPDDIEVLRATKPSDELADKILIERLVHGDKEAIPAMIGKLVTDDRGFWWQYGRYLWSPELTETLDEHLRRRSARTKRTWAEDFESDWITHEMVQRLPTDEAERIMLKHWAHLRFSPSFVQTALFISTPRLLEAAKATIDECPEPTKLMQHLSFHFGILLKGSPGLSREAQVLALAPYLHLLSPMDLGSLWETCNKHGWFTIRQELLDAHLKAPFPRCKWDRNQAASKFDKILAEKHHILWIDHEIDQFLEAGVSWIEILSTMTMWQDERRSLEALQLVAAAVKHRGTREDLCALKYFEGMPESIARQLIADTQFAVRRRRIR